MEQEKDQQNKPLEQREGLQDTNETGDEIRSGAREENQLEEIKENIPPGGRDAYPERQAGAIPTEGDNKLDNA